MAKLITFQLIKSFYASNILLKLIYQIFLCWIVNNELVDSAPSVIAALEFVKLIIINFITKVIC